MKALSTLLLAALLLPPAAEAVPPGGQRQDATYEEAPPTTNDETKRASVNPYSSRSSAGTGDPPITPEGRKVVDGILDQVNRGDFSGLDRDFGRLIRSEARNSQAWLDFITDAVRQAGGDPNSASRDFWRRYADVYEDDPGAHSGLGRSNLASGDYNSAVADYTRAIEMGEATPENFYGRGLAAEKLGDHEMAHQDAALALQMKPGDPTAHSLYQLTRGRMSEAKVNPHTGQLSAAAQAAARTPPSTDGAVPAAAPGGRAPAAPPKPDAAVLSAKYADAAQKHLKMGDVTAAIGAARKAVDLNVMNARAHNLLATAYDRNGDHAAAVAAANKALKIKPDSVPALNTRAWAFSGQKKYRPALSDSERVLGLDPNNAYGFLNKGRALGGLGRRSDMLDALSRSAALDPRFQILRDQAVQLPPDQDTELLFAGLMSGRRAALPLRRPGKSRGLLIMIGVLCGGLLIAFGFLSTFSSWRERLTGRLTGRSTAASGGTSETGRVVGGFEVLRIVGTGGMGEVYEAVDRKLDRRVAIKKLKGEIRDNPRERARFVEEARTVAALRHPNIVQIHSIVEDGADIFLIFEYVDGRGLDEILKERALLPLQEALIVLRGVCAALEYAHSRGVVHRDLKPSNIMVDREGISRVMDFGVARSVKPVPTKPLVTTTVWGTPSYMAPEAEEGAVNRESDIFSLGVCAYEMLAGQLPFKGSAGAMFLAKKERSFTPLFHVIRDLPRGVDRAVASALSPDPAQRPKTALQFWEAVVAGVKA